MKRRRKTVGFTLIELATVMVIIALLASSLLFAMFQVQQAAKQTRTRSQIAKLHQLIANRYAEYKTRSISARSLRFVRKDKIPYMRLLAIRDLMRMEMPERKTDLLRGPVTFNQWFGDTNTPQLQGNQLPSLVKSYHRRINTLTGLAPPWETPGGDGNWGISGVDDDGNGTTDDFSEFGWPGSDDLGWTYQYQGSECLYLILSAMRDGDKSALDYLHENEIGDIDLDGMPEILDGFGMPIEFLRWAPGQAPGVGPDGQWGAAGVDDDGDGIVDNLSEAMTPGSDDTESPSLIHNISFPDDFDPLQVDIRGHRAQATNPYPSFSLVPFIYSAGKDRAYGIFSDTPQHYVHADATFLARYYPNDPFTTHFTNNRQFGATATTNFDWVDNVSNHNIEVD